MIVFFAKNAEEIALSAIIKHFNPSAILRCHESNEDLIKIAKMHNESNFIRVKDYKMAIISKYDFPQWIKDDLKLGFIELALANKNANPYSIISHLAENLFFPEKIFYSSLDKCVMLKDLAMQSIRELGLFKKYAKKYQKNGIIYHEINPEHDIMELYAKSIKKKCSEPFIVLCHDKAMAANARRLGFINDFAIMDRYEALSIKMKINAGLPEKNGLKKTIATKIIEFS